MASQGSVTAVVVEGLQKISVPTKHYLFLLRVRRSDGSEYTLRKSYEEFVALEKEVMKTQIDTSALNKLRLKKTGVTGTTGSHRTATKRQHNISAYCDALLTIDDLIINSDAVKAFFQPEYRQTNETGSRLIANFQPSVEQQSWEKAAGPKDISAPMDLPVYRTTVAYKADDERQISLQANLHVHVFQKCYSGWWFVIYKNKSGWFPATHLESVEPENHDDDDEPGQLQQPQKYVAVSAYTAKYDDEISFPVDAVVDVLHKKMDGWWLLSFCEKTGVGPSKYLKACDVDAERCECKMCDDTLDMKSTVRRKSTVESKSVSRNGSRSETGSHSSRTSSENNDSFNSRKSLDQHVTVVGGSQFYSHFTEADMETELTGASVHQSVASVNDDELESSAHGFQTKL